MFTRFGLALSILLAAGNLVRAADPPLHFWLSNSATEFAGPTAPQLQLTAGSSANLYLWCRPSTGANLRNFSLHLVANQSGADLVDGTFTIFNTSTAAADRFEFVTDSTLMPPLLSDFTELQVAAGSADRLGNLQGFTLFPAPNIVGLGSKCAIGEMNCGVAADGKPAWLLGSIGVKALTPGANVELFLQVGDFGANQFVPALGDYDQNGTNAVLDFDQWDRNFGSVLGLTADGNGNGVVDAADYNVWRDHLGATSALETTAQTNIQFGVDSTPLTPPVSYNAFSERGLTKAGDTADAVIVVAGPGGGSVGSVVPEPPVSSLLLGVWLAAAKRRRL
ncbi:MAG: hypothetical protein AB7G28_15770 [Pirellulales bacterium]